MSVLQGPPGIWIRLRAGAGLRRRGGGLTVEVAASPVLVQPVQLTPRTCSFPKSEHFLSTATVFQERSSTAAYITSSKPVSPARQVRAGGTDQVPGPVKWSEFELRPPAPAGTVCSCRLHLCTGLTWALEGVEAEKECEPCCAGSGEAAQAILICFSGR